MTMKPINEDLPACQVGECAPLTVLASRIETRFVSLHQEVVSTKGEVLEVKKAITNMDGKLADLTQERAYEKGKKDGMKTAVETAGKVASKASPIVWKILTIIAMLVAIALGLVMALSTAGSSPSG